jgi:hypothetical protein
MIQVSYERFRVEPSLKSNHQCIGLSLLFVLKALFSFRFFAVEEPFSDNFSCEMRGGVLAQALSSQSFRPFSAIFRFVFSLDPTFLYALFSSTHIHLRASLARLVLL